MPRLGIVHAPPIWESGDSLIGSAPKLSSASPTSVKFETLLASLHPFAWWKGNDVPSGGTALDYGSTGSSLVPPAAPPHNLTIPAHIASVSGWTSDGKPGLGWDGTNQARMDWTGSANNDLPQGDAWSFLIVNKSSPGDGQQTLFGHSAGLGVDSDGKSHFIVYTGAGGVDGKMQLQTDYLGGSNVTAILTDARLNDGAYHLIVVNVYPTVPGTPARIMNYDLYIDGAFVATTQMDSGGFSYFYGGANDSSIPDGFHVGGYSPTLAANGRTKGQMQHHAIFIGGAVAPFGGMLTPAQIAALYAAR